MPAPGINQGNSVGTKGSSSLVADAARCGWLVGVAPVVLELKPVFIAFTMLGHFAFLYRRVMPLLLLLSRIGLAMLRLVLVLR